jgi:hypothetical protein
VTGDERRRAAERSEVQIRALESLHLVANEYGLAKLKKPCIAYVLDGNGGGAARHEEAFVIALECRALELTERETERVLTRWARKIGYRPRDACRAIRNAYAKVPGGGWRYYPPGLRKRQGTVAERVLAAICSDIGCPANCPAFRAAARVRSRFPPSDLDEAAR